MNNLPQNPDLVVCPFCLAKGVKSIFAQLLPNAAGLFWKKGGAQWAITAESMELICLTCDSVYMFYAGKGIYLIKPQIPNPSTTQFYAITLEAPPSGSLGTMA